MNSTGSWFRRVATPMLVVSSFFLISSVAHAERKKSEGRVTGAEAAAVADPAAKALQASADEAVKAANAIEAQLKRLEGEIKSLETMTDQVKSKSDLDGITKVNRQLTQVKALSTKLGTDAETIKRNARVMDSQMGKLKK